MDILSLFLAKLSFIWEIAIPFLVALTILVFVHELGHYAIARWYNVKVEVFSIGFGPEIKGWDDSHGTRWKISAVPLGASTEIDLVPLTGCLPNKWLPGTNLVAPFFSLKESSIHTTLKTTGGEIATLWISSLSKSFLLIEPAGRCLRPFRVGGGIHH